jgi:phage pi2 protein 07
LLKIQIDEEEIRKIYLEKVQEKIKELESEMVWWSTKELMRQTDMCWNTIQKKFFFDPRFVKHKVGAEWRFPAEESKKFLLQWLSEQPRA